MISGHMHAFTNLDINARMSFNSNSARAGLRKTNSEVCEVIWPLHTTPILSFATSWGRSSMPGKQTGALSSGLLLRNLL